ncbi:MAG: hypothetical protein ACJAWL_000386 [Motiliproteus sp.]|jgi:hypothetical protein
MPLSVAAMLINVAEAPAAPDAVRLRLGYEPAVRTRHQEGAALETAVFEWCGGAPPWEADQKISLAAYWRAQGAAYMMLE